MEEVNDVGTPRCARRAASIPSSELLPDSTSNAEFLGAMCGYWFEA